MHFRFSYYQQADTFLISLVAFDHVSLQFQLHAMIMFQVFYQLFAL